MKTTCCTPLPPLTSDRGACCREARDRPDRTGPCCGTDAPDPESGSGRDAGAPRTDSGDADPFRAQDALHDGRTAGGGSGGCCG